MNELQSEFTALWQTYVERLSEYMASTGKRYENHAATIRRWIQKDKPRRTPDYSCAEGDSL